jgi:regulatory protein
LEHELKKALGYAFLLLKYRPRTRHEIKIRLGRKKYSHSVIAHVLAYLEDYNYIDDQEFAGIYVKEKLRLGFGQKRIVFELKRLGIPEELIETTCNEVAPEIDTKSVLRDLISKMQGRNKSRQQVLRYLVQRGFRYREIMEELNEY